jgi:hypothetical protein
VDADFDDSSFGGFGDDAMLEGASEEVGEDGEDVETHLIVKAFTRV